MTLYNLSPQNYRAFIVGKLVRDGILLDALAREGYAFATRPAGRLKLLLIAAKLIEEIDEFLEAGSEAEWNEELGDLYDIIGLAELAAGELTDEDNQGHLLEFDQIQSRLMFFMRLVEDVPSLSDELLKRYLRRLLAELHNAINMNARVDDDEIVAIRAKKNEAKGRHTGWYAEAIILPFGDDWCEYFAQRFTELRPGIFNIDMALTPDSIRHLSG
ncbi:MAG: hypothetical protein DI585_00775 [Pseudomonas fluorescens]|nr:MAG: hypothetical protein DI585_00775 [Pseudomonas fluorescens]